MIGYQRIGVLAASAIVVVGLAACSAGAPEPSETSTERQIIKVGLSGSFSGATAFYGQEAEKGAELAIAQLNEADGPYSYELVTADDECTPDGGASAYSSLIDNDGVDVILGSPCSGATLSGITLLERAGVPNVVVSSTNAAITQQGNDYVWRVNLDDAAMAEVYSAFIAEQGIENIATIAANNDFGRGAVETYKPLLAENGLTQVAEEYYTQGAGDFRVQLTNIAASGADAILMVGAYGDAVVLLQQARELGIEIPLYARGDVVSSGFVELAADPTLGEGTVEATNWDPTYDSYPEMAEAYQEMFGETPKSYGVQAWIGMQVIAQAAEAGGADAAGIQAGLESIDWDSPIGPIAFDESHQAHHDMFLTTLEGGEVALLERVSAGS